MKHFKLDEFKCKCGKCDGGVMDNTFLQMLDDARSKAGVPFVITSGFRCSAHNKAVGGKATSAHLEGRAADISYKSSSAAFRILKALLEAGFTRIGHNPKHKFFHVDSSPNLPKEVFFDY